jgi:LuxR family maltose regulon positive regulatory protein
VVNDLGDAGEKLRSLGLPDKNLSGDASRILSSVSCEAETWFFIDDFQNLARAACVDAWGDFWRRRDERFHVVVMTRHFDDLRLRGYPGVCWLDYEDLALDADDTAKFFAASGVKLDGRDAALVSEFTGGCVMDLLFEMNEYFSTGKFLRMNEATNDDLKKRHSWRKLSAAQKNFLLRISPFDSYTMEQAAFTLGLGPGDPLPHEIREISGKEPLMRHSIYEGIFLPHDYLLRIIRSELELIPDLRSETLRRAAEWRINRGHPEDAVAYYCASHDYDAALSLDIMGRDVSPNMGMTYEEITVGIVRNSSREVRLRYPIHFLKHAFNLLDVGRVDVFKEACAEFERVIEGIEIAADDKNRLFGELTLLSSFGEYNDISKMAALMKRAHELTGGRPSLIRMNDPWTFGNTSVLFMYHSVPGKLDEELSEMYRGCGYYFALTEGHGSGGDFLMEAEARLNRGDPREAVKLARKALVQSEKRRQRSVSIGACLLLARAAILSGDVGQVAQMMETLSGYSAIARRDGERSDRQEAEMAVSCVALLLGNPGKAVEWIQNGRAGEEFLKHIHAAPYALTLYGKYLLRAVPEGSRKDVEAAKKWLDTVNEVLELSKRPRLVMGEVYCHILSACAYCWRGDLRSAVSSLTSALSIALPDRLLLPFAEHYETISPVLRECGRIDSGDSVADEIRALAKRLEVGRSAYWHALHPHIPFGLTEREYKIACLAAERLHNKEIGKKLFLSEKTIKNCLSVIYGKIGRRGRTYLAASLDETGFDWRSRT